MSAVSRRLEWLPATRAPHVVAGCSEEGRSAVVAWHGYAVPSPCVAHSMPRAAPRGRSRCLHVACRVRLVGRVGRQSRLPRDRNRRRAPSARRTRARDARVAPRDRSARSPSPATRIQCVRSNPAQAVPRLGHSTPRRSTQPRIEALHMDDLPGTHNGVASDGPGSSRGLVGDRQVLPYGPGFARINHCATVAGSLACG